MTKVLDWVKSNVFIVVFIGLMLVAVIGAPITAGWLNESVKQDAQKRAQNWTQLTSIEKTQFRLDIPGRPPVEETVTVNPMLNSKYREVIEILKEDAGAVRRKAVEHNRKGRTFVIDGLFPEPAMEQRETIPFEFHNRLVAAYQSLLDSIRAGSPPTREQLRDDLQRREIQYIDNTLKKQRRDQLDASELASLTEELSTTRLAKAGDTASRISLYASLQSLNVPQMPQNRLPSLSEMFNWQWAFWITEDVLMAINDARGPDDRVLDSPVKRITSLRILNSVNADSTPSSPLPASDGAASADPAIAASSADVPIDVTAEALRDYAVSFTGRKSNNIYDVRLVELKVVVATIKLPELVDAIAKRNFMTVLDVTISPTDVFEAARQGERYGKLPVSDVTLLVETIWLREWTTEKMPAQLKNAITSGATPPPAL